MSIFDNVDVTKRPDNRYSFLWQDDTDEIVVGATAEHVFELPFPWTDALSSCNVLYSQGVDFVLAKLPTIDSKVDKTYLKVILTPEETKLFSRTGLDTRCQVKLFMADGSVYYDNVKHLRVLMPIDHEED